MDVPPPALQVSHPKLRTRTLGAEHVANLLFEVLDQYRFRAKDGMDVLTLVICEIKTAESRDADIGTTKSSPKLRTTLLLRKAH